MKPAHLASLIATSGFAIPGLCQLGAVTGRLAETKVGLDSTVRGQTQPVDAAADAPKIPTGESLGEAIQCQRGSKALSSGASSGS